LARLSLEEGHAADAETVIRKCKEQFHQDGQADDELAASVTLMEGLLDEGKPVEAAKEEQASRALAAKSTNQLNRLQFDLVSARVELAIGHMAAARPKLQRTLDSARAHLLLGIELETRLTLAELKRKLRTGSRGARRSRRIGKTCARQGIRPDRRQIPVGPHNDEKKSM